MRARLLGDPARILVGIDGSDDGLRAVDYGVAEARLRGTALHLVQAVDPNGLFGTPIPGRARDAIIAAAQRSVKAALRRAAASGFPRERLTTEVALGKPASVLLEQSRSASLIVLGRRGLSGLERVFAGSTSAAVSGSAHCPTVVVPHGWRPPSTALGVVGIGIDGTPRARGALEAAFAEAETRGAELRVVYAWEPPVPNYGAVADYLDALAIWTDTAELEMAEELAGWQADFPDVKLTRRFVRAHPATALVDLSARVDVLFIGVGGDGRRQHQLGAVARALVAGALCPVALIRDARPDPRAGEESGDVAEPAFTSS